MSLCLHCPECGTDNPWAWEERDGTPTICSECRVQIVDGCDGCEHQFMAMDHLDEIAADLAPISALFAD